MTAHPDLYLDLALQAARQLNAAVDAREAGQVEKAALLRAAAGRTLGEARELARTGETEHDQS